MTFRYPINLTPPLNVLPVNERTVEVRRAEIIRDNDAIRHSLDNGPDPACVYAIAATDRVIHSDLSYSVAVAIKHYDQFTPDIDPRGLHEWGRIELQGEIFYFRIEYFDQDGLTPVNPFRKEPFRRLTIMHLLDT